MPHQVPALLRGEYNGKPTLLYDLFSQTDAKGGLGKGLKSAQAKLAFNIDTDNKALVVRDVANLFVLAEQFDNGTNGIPQNHAKAASCYALLVGMDAANREAAIKALQIIYDANPKFQSELLMPGKTIIAYLGEQIIAINKAKADAETARLQSIKRERQLKAAQAERQAKADAEAREAKEKVEKDRLAALEEASRVAEEALRVERERQAKEVADNAEKERLAEVERQRVVAEAHVRRQAEVAEKEKAEQKVTIAPKPVAEDLTVDKLLDGMSALSLKDAKTIEAKQAIHSQYFLREIKKLAMPRLYALADKMHGIHSGKVVDKRFDVARQVPNFFARETEWQKLFLAVKNEIITRRKELKGSDATVKAGDYNADIKRMAYNRARFFPVSQPASQGVYEHTFTKEPVRPGKR